MTKAEQLAQLAESKIGVDFTNNNLVPKEVSCSFAVTTLVNQIDKRVAIQPGTTIFWSFMDESELFERIWEPERGCIIISPTGTNTRPETMPHGHVGIYLDTNRIVSNDSASGLWIENYSRESWRKRYHYDGGYPVKLYRLKG